MRRVQSRCTRIECKERVMDTSSVEEEAKRLIESLPDDSTWEDLIYRIYIRETRDAESRPGLQKSGDK